MCASPRVIETRGRNESKRQSRLHEMRSEVRRRAASSTDLVLRAREV